MLSPVSEPFSVKVDEFEGPLELLLDLVEKRKLAINKVSLANIADEFVGYIQKLEQPGMGVLADFLLVASTLMLIKSLALLPTLTISDEETSSIEDLERRLKIYQVVKDAAAGLRATLGKQPIYFRAHAEQVIVFAPTPELTLERLQAAINDVIHNLPKTEVLPQTTVQKVISLEEMIGDLTRRIEVAVATSFTNLVKDKKDKINVIIGFLALLELVKRGIIEVKQQDHFEEINIERSTTDSTPRYT